MYVFIKWEMTDPIESRPFSARTPMAREIYELHRGRYNWYGATKVPTYIRRSRGTTSNRRTVVSNTPLGPSFYCFTSSEVLWFESLSPYFFCPKGPLKFLPLTIRNLVNPDDNFFGTFQQHFSCWSHVMNRIVQCAEWTSYGGRRVFQNVGIKVLDQPNFS